MSDHIPPEQSDFDLPDESFSLRKQELFQFRQLTDGVLSAEKFFEVESRLLSDNDYRDRYLEFIRLEAAMEESLVAIPEEFLDENGIPQSVRKTERTSRIWTLLVGAACLSLTLVILFLLNRSSGSRPFANDREFALSPDPSPKQKEKPVDGNSGKQLRSIELNPAASTQPPEPGSVMDGNGNTTALTSSPSVSSPVATSGHQASQEAEFAAKLIERFPDAAVVTHIDELGLKHCTPAVKVGSRLKPGFLKVEKGRVQLDFLDGAMVVVEGPAELLLLSPSQATLISGRASAQVPEIARGFVMNGPNSAVYDLGTEFTLSVENQEISEVHVLNGEVEVSLLGDDGNTLQSQRIQEEETVRISRGMNRLETAVAPVTPPSFERVVAPPLNVPEEYCKSVLNEGARLYWRFEDPDQKLVRNEVGPELAGRIVPDSSTVSGIQQLHGQLNLSASAVPRFVESDRQLDWLNSYSVELWASPNGFHHGDIVAIFPEDDRAALSHLVVLELAYRTSIVHIPGAFRFLHRSPPTTGGGLNLFSQQSCVPGQWHHLVATKSMERLQFYLNGKLVRELKIEEASDTSHYNMILGELRPSVPERQFVGSIDEVAIYSRALTSEEVARHYALMKEAGNSL